VRTERQVELNRGFFELGPGMSAASPKLLPLPPDLPARMSIRWTGSLTPLLTGGYTLSLTSLGSARLLLDGQLLLEIAPSASAAAAQPAPGAVPAIGMAASAAQVATASLQLTEGDAHTATVEYAADAPEQSAFFTECLGRRSRRCSLMHWSRPGPGLTR
jgi:hypothetical protein